MPRRKPIIVIQGGQWGSEAKGAATAAIGRQRQAKVYVRTGTVNAGHTVYHKGGEYKMQQLPVGWVDPDAVLVLGAGAYISPDILEHEIRMINEVMGGDVRDRLIIDRNCGLHVSDHTRRSSESGRHHSIGATGKGCSEAVTDKIRNRGTLANSLFRNYVPSFNDHPGFTNLTGLLTDTSRYLNDQYEIGQQIIIEGTQGSHLDLHLGPYPYTTHKQTQAANWAAECGLGLGAEWEVALVIRTYPIRVAGCSGPMPYEITWQKLAVKINAMMAADTGKPLLDPEAIVIWDEMCKKVTHSQWPQFDEWALRQPAFQYHFTQVGGIYGPFPPDAQDFLSEMHSLAFNQLGPDTQNELKKLFEFTTVTKKLRRVSRFDASTVHDAIRWNRPKYLVMTFMNYWMPSLWGRTQLEGTDIRRLKSEILSLETAFGLPVEYFNVGPENQHFFNVPEVLRRNEPTDHSNGLVYDNIG